MYKGLAIATYRLADGRHGLSLMRSEDCRAAEHLLDYTCPMGYDNHIRCDPSPAWLDEKGALLHILANADQMAPKRLASRRMLQLR